MHVTYELQLQWAVGPAPDRITAALEGRKGPVRYGFRFEKRTKHNIYQADVTTAVIASSIELNNDREVLRTARFQIDPNELRVDLDPLKDHIAVFMRLLVDGSYPVDFQMGLFRLHFPRKSHRPNSEIWDVEASDLTIYLTEATTTTPYTLAANANYVSGANGVRAILAALDLRHNIEDPGLTTPVDRTWPPGTTWLRIINDMLQSINFYTIFPDSRGVFRSYESRELATHSPDVTYREDSWVLVPIEEEAELTRFANQVVVVVDDPNTDPLYAVATNSNPASPTSTLTLGRTITKTLTRTGAANQTTLDEVARRELEQSASYYRRAVLRTPIDPRREAHEVYQLDVEAVTQERWWCRNWTADLRIGAEMTHIIAKVESIG